MQATISSTVSQARAAEAVLASTIHSAAAQLDLIGVTPLADALNRLQRSATGCAARLTLARTDAVGILGELAGFLGAFGGEITAPAVPEAPQLTAPVQPVVGVGEHQPEPPAVEKYPQPLPKAPAVEPAPEPIVVEVEPQAPAQPVEPTVTVASPEKQVGRGEEQVVATAALSTEEPAPVAPLTPAVEVPDTSTPSNEATPEEVKAPTGKSRVRSRRKGS